MATACGEAGLRPQVLLPAAAALHRPSLPERLTCCKPAQAGEGQQHSTLPTREINPKLPVSCFESCYLFCEGSPQKRHPCYPRTGRQRHGDDIVKRAATDDIAACMHAPVQMLLHSLAGTYLQPAHWQKE